MIGTGIPVSDLILKLKNIPFFNKLDTGSMLQGIEFFSGLDKAALEKISGDIILHEFEDVSFKEIAERTNVSVNTLLSRKRYAIIHLRKRLQSLYNLLNSK